MYATPGRPGAARAGERGCAMIPTRRLLAGAVAGFLQAITVPAHGAAPPSPKVRAAKTEIEWQILEITRDISEMIVVTTTGAAPASGFAVGIVDAPAAATLSVSVTLAAGGPTVVEPVSCPDFAASPEAYHALTKKLLQASGLTRRGQRASAPGPFLERLSDFQVEALAKENARISSWLEQEPLSPEAHEEAALLLGTLALKEQAGEFHDPREAILRASAHLAVAGALRAGEAASPTGFFAREALRAALGDQAGVHRAVKARRAARTPSASEKAWTNALEIHATGNWKSLATPLTATLLERVMYFRALLDAVDDTVAVSFIAKRNSEPVADWGRAALARQVSVGVGNAFTAQALLIEIAEVATVAEVERPELVAKADPRGLAAVLKSEGTRTLEASGGKARLRAVPWSLWSRYFQRHLMHAALMSHRHLAQTLAMAEEAREMRAEMEPLFAGLELAPLVREPILYAIGYEELDSDGKKTPWDRDAGAMFAARSFVQGHPELATPYQWKRIGDPPGWVGDPGEHRHDAWFAFAEGPFDITRSIFARDYRTLLKDPQFERLGARRPFDREVLAALAEKRHGERLTLSAFDTTYAALLDFDVNVMKQRAELLRKSFVEYRRQMEKVVALNPCDARTLIHASMARGTEDETAELVRKYAADCDDTVAVSHLADYLIEYEWEKGRAEEAGKLARAMAETGSGAGLEAMADHLEAQGKIDEAADYHRQIQERYGRDLSSAGFYARHRARSERYAAEAARLEKEIFPRGLERVTLADFKGAPTNGVRSQAPYWPAAWNLGDDAVIGAVDGYRIHTARQYAAARSITRGKQLRLIVWDGMSWREVSAELRLKSFGGPLVDYAPVRDDPQAYLAKHLAECEAGGPSAASGCASVGSAYEQGWGVAKDPAKAAEYFKKACAAGSPMDCDRYARTPQGQADPGAANATVAQFMARCATPTGAFACYELAELYQWGTGVPKDLKKAEQLYRQACERGEGQSCHTLGVWYKLGQNGLPRDAAQVLAFLGKACQAQFGGGACDMLGEMYETGDLVARDEAKAVAYFHRACETNSQLGCLKLGDRYETGRGVPKDEKRAAGYWDQLCDESNSTGCRRLAALYESGRGVVRDPSAAAAFLAKANDLDRRGCQNGDPRACEALRAAGAR